LGVLVVKKVDHLFWEEQIAKLPLLSQKCNSYKEFTKATLQNLVESLSLKRATHLTCVLEKGHIDCDVTAETFPADHDLVTLKSSELKLLLVNVILEGTNERYMEQTLMFEGEKLDVKVFQIHLPESNAQHILVLTAIQQGPEDLQPSDEDKKAGFKYLAHFAEIAASMTVTT
jgi:hypothetical protein